MKKNCFLLAGIAVLSLGMATVSCSSTDVYDENYAKNAEDNQRIAKYEQAFTQAFGQVNKNHQWGFDQTTGMKTRQAITQSNQVWDIPENLWGGAQNKEGWNANELGEGKKAENEAILANAFKAGTAPSTSLDDFSFDNYFLQHVEQPNGGNIKNSIVRLEAYNSNSGEWETVTNFSAGKNNADFTIEADATYYYGNINRSAKGTTLMANMGGNPDGNNHLFRVVEKNGNSYEYNYNYRLLRMDAYHKDLNKTIIEDEPFLFFQFPPKNDNKGESYWVIRLGVAEILETPVVAEGRVLCEDMGANDFDFNDVVFDAWMYKNGDIKIQILAHGGELDIKVAGVPVELEKMSNTGLKSVATQEFTILAADHNYTSIDQIPVEVFPNGFAANISFPLEANTGKVPQKVCAPVGTAWPDEYIKISNAYTSFNTWVTDSDPARWTFQTKPRLVNLNLKDNDNPEQD